MNRICKNCGYEVTLGDASGPAECPCCGSTVSTGGRQEKQSGAKDKWKRALKIGCAVLAGAAVLAAVIYAIAIVGNMVGAAGVL